MGCFSYSGVAERIQKLLGFTVFFAAGSSGQIYFLPNILFKRKQQVRHFALVFGTTMGKVSPLAAVVALLPSGKTDEYRMVLSTTLSFPLCFNVPHCDQIPINESGNGLFFGLLLLKDNLCSVFPYTGRKDPRTSFFPFPIFCPVFILTFRVIGDKDTAELVKSVQLPINII